MRAHHAGVALFERLRERCTAWAQGRYKGLRAEKLDASFLQRKRADLTIWGEDDAPAAEAVAATAAAATAAADGSNN